MKPKLLAWRTLSDPDWRLEGHLTVSIVYLFVHLCNVFRPLRPHHLQCLVLGVKQEPLEVLAQGVLFFSMKPVMVYTTSPA